MNIIHIKNLANTGMLFAEEQRKMGHNALCMEYFYNDIQPSDLIIEPDMNHSKIRRMLSMSRELYRKCIKGFDLIHFHHEPSFIGHSYLKLGGMDYPFLKLMKKKIILQYHGINPMKYDNFFTQNFPNCRFISTPNQFDFAKKDVVLLPDPVDVSKYKYEFKENEGEIVIMTGCINIEHEKIKGTNYMRRAVKKLQDEGYNIKLKVIRKVPHDKAVELYKDADIVIDQLIVGWHGVFALENMLLGKPVCCYIMEKYDSYIPDNAIWKVNKENLAEQLKPLIEDISLRKQIADSGRKYALKNHESKKCTENLMKWI